MMRKLIYSMGYIALLLTGCYDDKGNYDYISLNNVTIGLPQTSYTIPMGGHLRIEPDVSLAIDDSELVYDWQVYAGTQKNNIPFDEYRQFHNLYTGKVLDYDFVNDGSLITGLGPYSLRLCATHTPTGRKFYSSIFNITIAGVTGLLVLHDDNQTSDIGLIVADEFMPQKQSVETSIMPNFYSAANAGERIEGKGIQVVHSLASWSFNELRRCYVVAITDKKGVLAEYTGLQYFNNWDYQFYGKLNQEKGYSQPTKYYIIDTQNFAFDGNELYVKSQSGDDFFVAPDFSQHFNGEEDIIPAPYLMEGGWYLVVFDNKDKVFYYTSAWSMKNITPLICTEPFNPAEMKAELIYMDQGGASNHNLAVMKNIANPLLGEKDQLSLIELNFTKKMSEVASYIYDMSQLPSINQAKFYAFGESQVNMCYYATPQNVYQFAVFDGEPLQASPLCMEDGTSITFDGEITCCKVLKPNKASNFGGLSFVYYNYNKIMVVASYNKEGKGTIYSMELNQMNGRVSKLTKYEGNFGYIRDVNLKGI